MGANELKEILGNIPCYTALNNQPKTGNKTELAERCADGKLLGRTPSCSECGGGKLRFNRTNVLPDQCRESIIAQATWMTATSSVAAGTSTVRR